MKAEKIRTAVIPAAGAGIRFLPITRAQPKEMLPVVDKPVIQYVVEEAIASGMDDILIVTGRGKRAIEDHFDNSCEIERRLREKKDEQLLAEYEELSSLADIHYIRQKEPRGLGDAVLLAERHCACEPFTVLLGDTITIPSIGEAQCAAQMVDTYEKYSKPVIAVEEVTQDKIKDYGIIDGALVESGVYSIRDIIEKPEPIDAPSNLGAIGRYLLEPEIFDRIREIPKGYGGEIQLTDALRTLDSPIGLVTKCRRYDIGDKPGWMRSNIELILDRPEFADEMRQFLTELIERTP
ncbi:MAG TPA: UTP--glucose-1-phosphate uridylyltransferase GalU [Methanospirillum sp.]|nr:UTP--glucose-1-phosphate uridylyltransferase GalU [Methanospirillum sp.]